MNLYLNALQGLLVTLTALPLTQPSTTLPARLASQIASDYYSAPARLATLQSIPRWRYYKLRLNKGGLIGYIVRREDPDFCGSGGCGMLIYTELNGRFRSLYDGSEFYGEYTSRGTLTNGLFDLECKNVLKDGSFYFHTLWFDGKQYQSAKQGVNRP